jgi:hypothetical protein
VDVDRAAWTDQSISHCYQDHTDGPCFLLQIVHLHELFPQGDHSWLELHPGGPEPVLGHFQKEHAGDGMGIVVLPPDNVPVCNAVIVKIWTAAKSFILLEHVHHISLDRVPADFLLLIHRQEAAGWQDSDPGALQDHVGGGHKKRRQGGLRRHPPAVV